jgi:methionyl-tRNA synthetase
MQVTPQPVHESQHPVAKPEVTYEEFAALDIRIATILSVNEIVGADKLWEIRLDVGELGERTVAAGIKPWYQPTDLVGKQVPYLANLAPRLLRGVTSHGMLIAAGAGRAFLLHPEKELKAGEIVR